MHSKVIVASLVFALATGFGSAARTNSKIAQPKAEKEICNVQEIEHIHPSGVAKKAAVIRSSSGETRLCFGLSPTGYLNGSSDYNWFSFTAPFKGKFVFTSSGSLQTAGALYYSMNSNTSQYASDNLNGAKTNFKITYQFDEGQKLYLRVTTPSGGAGEYTLSLSHTHTYNIPKPLNFTQHKMMCECGAYSTQTLTVDDYMDGHGRTAVHCSTCNNWVDIIPQSHQHDYCFPGYYSTTQHRMICECGNFVYQNHSYDQVVYTADSVQKHCSVCNAWVEFAHTHSYTSQYTRVSDVYHKAICACGQSIQQEHVFTSFAPYGHGHNDMICCRDCGAGVEITIMDENVQYSHSVASQGVKWYRFTASETATYVFATTGSSDPYASFYVGDYPTATPTNYDDYNGNRNFRITTEIPANTTVYLRVRGWNWNAASYTLSVIKSHVHNYNQLVSVDGQTHNRVCSCGATIPEPHEFTYSSVNETTHRLTCACGYSRTERHNYDTFIPYGHGHNDSIYCSVCNHSEEITIVDEGCSYDDEVDGDSIWYRFTAAEAGTYIFETTGDFDTLAELYRGDFPNGQPVTYDDINDDNYNFRITVALSAGETIYLRVREYDNGYANYVLHINAQHVHNYGNPEYYDGGYHQVTCACGETKLEQHVLDDYMNGHGRTAVHCAVCDRWIDVSDYPFPIPEELINQ